MQKSALRFLILTGLFKVALCSLFGKNVYVYDRKTWSEARKYCREHHTDLSSISNQEEDEELRIMENQEYKRAWIGLYRDADDTWKWSGGKNASFFKWAQWGNASEENRCVVRKRGQRGWYPFNCEMNKSPFYCFESSLALVKENKTWEEAIEHCRYQYTDLVSLPSESALVRTLQTSREAQTDQVWTGLRYLADNWLWMNGEVIEYQARSPGETPQCPAWSHRCGALSLEEQHWDSWDCADKLNFVCY